MEIETNVLKASWLLLTLFAFVPGINTLETTTSTNLQITRHNSGDVFSHHTDTTVCTEETCVGISSGTATAISEREMCKCRCHPHLPAFREDLRICVDDIHGSEGGSASQGGSEGSFGLRRGKCKWFNVAKGWGFITPDDGGQDVFVHQSVIQMTGFRSLADDEEIEFECQVSEKGLEATKVTGPQSSDCRGSHRRPISRKRYRKIRCYNCGEFANHVAAKCELGPQPKRCHNCKSEEHLIADCPLRTEKSQTPKSEESPDKSGNGNAATSRESSSTVSEGLQPE